MPRPDVSLRLAYQGHDLFLIPSHGGTYLLYAPTLKKLLRITGHLAGRLSAADLAKPGADSGVNQVVSIMQQATGSAIEPLQHNRLKSRFFHLALGLTASCNLACLYCHADAGGPATMTKGILEAALLHAFGAAQAQQLAGVNVSFAVGGEPTTRWALFRSCVDRIRALESSSQLPAHLSITTNGAYGDTKRRFLADAFDSILVSFDGPDWIQNKHRPTKAGAASFPHVLASARYFLRHAKSVSFRATVSNLSVRSLPAIVEFFAAELGSGYHLVFEPLVPLGRAKRNQATLAGPAQEDFVDAYLLAKARGGQLGIEVRTSAAQPSRLVSAFCGALAIPSFTVTTGGVVTTCERDATGGSYGYGHYDKAKGTFVLDDRAIRRNAALVTLRAECRDCFCKWHCAGDCPDVRTVGYERCYINRRLVQHELERLAGAQATPRSPRADVLLGGVAETVKGG